MNISKICCTSLPHLNLDIKKKLKNISRAGYKGVGLWKSEIDRYLKEGYALSEIKTFITENKLEAVELHMLQDWLFVEGQSWKQAKKSMIRMCEIANSLNIKNICAPSYGKGSLNIARKNLKNICRIASNYGLDVAFEFLGWEQIARLKMAKNLIYDVAESNCGLIIDTAHFFTGDSTWEELEDTPVNIIKLLHINDLSIPYKKLSNKKMREKTRCNRVIPLDGNFPLQKFMSIMKSKNYQGYISLEILNTTITKHDYSNILNLGLERLISLIYKS